MSKPDRSWDAYPNLESAIGTSVPVVTTVLAAIGTATYVVPLQDETANNSSNIGPLPFSYVQLGVVLGIFATGCFVVATLAAVYAHATAFDALPADRQTELLATAEEENTRRLLKEHYRSDSKRRYQFARMLWMVGLGLLALTTGAVAHKLVEAMVPVSALGGLAVGAATIKDGSGWANNLCGVLVVVASLAFGGTIFL